MRTMLVCIAVLVFAASSASAGIIEYYNEAAFLAAVGALGTTSTTETFSGAALGVGVSVNSTNGYIDTAAGNWWDRVIPGEATTIWTFTLENPLIGWGGTFDLAGPGGPGTNLAFYADGVSVGAELLNSTAGTFFGFISNVAFTEVLVIAGSDPSGWCETYTMDNMDYARTPEPGSLVLICAGLALMTLRAARRK